MPDLFLIDVHAHLQDEKFSNEVDTIIADAAKAGVKRIINAGTCVETSAQALAIAQKHRGCKALVGIHPHDASKFDDQTIAVLKKMASAPETLGIGEIGLDYHYNFSPPETQIRVFRTLWQLAVELQMPAIIHVREAFDDFFAAIAEMPAPPKVLLHCFSGDLDIARRAADMGFHFSIGGALTFPKSDMTREVFKHLPENLIHLETDCPYLAPQPRRGKRCEPAFIPMTLEYLAKIRQKPVEQMAETLKKNAVAFFGPALLE